MEFVKIRQTMVRIKHAWACRRTKSLS